VIASRSPGSSIAKLLAASSATKGNPLRGQRPSATRDTEAFGINDSGQIVGLFLDGTGPHGFLYTAGIFTTIDNPSATSDTVAFGINNSGQIVGAFSDGTGTHGFLATPTAVPELGSWILLLTVLTAFAFLRLTPFGHQYGLENADRRPGARPNWQSGWPTR
jgi:probable HAF family extracellular repeat protein